MKTSEGAFISVRLDPSYSPPKRLKHLTYEFEDNFGPILVFTSFLQMCFPEILGSTYRFPD